MATPKSKWHASIVIALMPGIWEETRDFQYSAMEAYSPTFGLQYVFDKVVHTCGGGSKVVNKYSFIKYSALCSNGTIYSQEMGVSSWEIIELDFFLFLSSREAILSFPVLLQTCHWSYLVDCESSEKYYFNQVVIVLPSTSNPWLNKYITEQHPSWLVPVIDSTVKCWTIKFLLQ